jgi:hypothetical protein
MARSKAYASFSAVCMTIPNLTGYRRSRELSLLKASVFCRTPRRAHCPKQDCRSGKNT